MGKCDNKLHVCSIRIGMYRFGHIRQQSNDLLVHGWMGTNSVGYYDCLPLTASIHFQNWPLLATALKPSLFHYCFDRRQFNLD